MPQWLLVDRYLLPPFVALGLLGLVTSMVYRFGRVGPLPTGLTAVGRTALSCYVFQNVVASALCYGWGLGLAARFAKYRPWWVLGAWAGICALFMVLAVYWLRRFDRGPVEMAWHWAYRAPSAHHPTHTTQRGTALVLDASAVVDLLLRNDMDIMVRERMSAAELHSVVHLDAEVFSALSPLHRAGELGAADVAARLCRNARSNSKLPDEAGLTRLG